MPLNDHPFTVIEDGHGNITGITFDKPVPWLRWDGDGYITTEGDDDMADRIAAAICPVPEEQRPQFKLDVLIDKVETEASFDNLRAKTGAALIMIDRLRKATLGEIGTLFDALQEQLQAITDSIHTASDELQDACRNAKKD